ncbi:hypothetical protein B9Z19DRAFT_574987 [Tuber borchii]|uniref:Extracellular membrane protein CFEM domain-containing protein n=1 Tax=Tuber borchii TaxID=42251 RepID=A0A2T6ZCE8_TUBBO|nr:hypothetical protein B9Z19DRAFT_574987 [Tuber borchii]
MQQWSLVRALTQLAFVANALVVAAVEGRALDEAHYKNAPGCLIECLGEWGVLEYPMCTPKKHYSDNTFNLRDFFRERRVASCFCGDSEVLASIGECVYSNVSFFSREFFAWWLWKFELIGFYSAGRKKCKN